MEIRPIPKQTRIEDVKPSCLKVGLQMTLCLSTAIAIMVKEDMKAAMQGKHLMALYGKDLMRVLCAQEEHIS